MDAEYQKLLDSFSRAAYDLLIYRIKGAMMSDTTLGQMIRALYNDADIESQYRGIINQAYAVSSAGSKPWMLTEKDKEHVVCVFNSMYATF